MQITDFDYDLPQQRIALTPPSVRGQSRLLVLDRRTSDIEHRTYADLVDYLEPGDLVVLNNTKVIKARLIARNDQDQPRELLLLEDHHNTDLTTRRALYRGRLMPGDKLRVGQTPITVESIEGNGIALVSSSTNLLELADQAGQVPLPPYLHRPPTEADTERYQTVFAQKAGSVAAPTASLNFTKELMDKVVAKGATIQYLTLHVGLGTFLPIRSPKIEQHHMHSEYFEVPSGTAEAMRQAKKSGRRIVAVGTTVARTLEFAHQDILDESGLISGEADIFIYPGYEFKLVDILLTNFHAPKSTVLMLAAAFAGWDNLQRAYAAALNHDYAFLSYGDSMMIK